MEELRNVLVMARNTAYSKTDDGKKVYNSFWTVDVYQYFDRREAERGADILTHESGVHVVALIPDSEIPDCAAVYDNT